MNRKTKTGLSTAAGELEKMKGQHPVVDKILEYRELSKLQSTYLLALPALVNKQTGRIHTSYNQTIAATGRLSSVDPNLQNIPVRNVMGRKIRAAFVERFVAGTRKLVVGDPTRAETQLGPVVSAGQRAVVEEFLAGARADGSVLIAGGEDKDGNVLASAELFKP